VHELKKIAPDTLVLIPRMERGPSAFAAVGATHLPRIPIGRLSRLYRTTLLYYAERSAYAFMVAGYLCAAQLQGRRYEVVYVREVISALWLSLLLPKLIGARVIYEVHDLEARNPSRAKESWAQPLLGLLDRLVLTKPAALTSLTGAFRDLLVGDGLRAEHDIAVLPDAYDAERYYPRDRALARRELGIPQQSPLVVYAGLTFAYRGVDMLLDAVAQARQHIPDLRLALVGGRPQELADLRAQAAQLGISAYVTFAGPQPQARVPAYLAAGDILAVPDTVTDVTASPLKLFEYMAMGRAIICPDIPALREITHGDGAIHIPRRNPAALADAIVRLAHDRELRATLGQRAIERVAPHTYAHRAERLLEIAQAVVRGDSIRDY
jgi:glycosyltransferase involved in cell wall biosynthesis